jgi:hypothetical protein
MDATDKHQINASQSTSGARLDAPRLRRIAGGLLLVALLIALLIYGLMHLFGGPGQFETFSLPYVQNFQAVDVKRWFLQDGVWSIRNEALAQTASLEKPAYLFIPQTVDVDHPYHLSVYMSLPRNGNALGINFNAQYPNLTQRMHQVSVVRQSTGELALIAGYMDALGQWTPQVSVPFSLDAGDYRLDLYVLANTYTVQLNGQTLIERRPLFYHGGLIGFYTLGPATFDTLKLTTADTTQPGELVYVSDFDQTPGGAGWTPFGGDWAISQGELVQADPVAVDAGIGYEPSSFENYVVRVNFHHLIGVGGGLLFNMPSPYQINSASVVRYAGQTNRLLWGFYDEQGNFTQQGEVDAPAPDAEPHQLRILSSEAGFDLHLDNQLLAQAVPQPRPYGHIGLLTSQSSVAFRSVEVYPLFGERSLPTLRTLAPVGDALALETPAATSVVTSTVPTGTPTPASRPTMRRTGPTPTPLAADSSNILIGPAAVFDADLGRGLREATWRPISGNWRAANGSLLQDDVVNFDQSIVYVGNAFRTFALTVTLRHLEGSGAGLLFNMPYADQLQGAHMVRFSERRPGGIFWGYFDASGRFVGEGYTIVEPPGDRAHTLCVISSAGHYSIYLDGVLLVEQVPLQTAWDYGFIGLIMSRSAAMYQSVEVSDAASAAGPKRTAIATPQPAAASQAIVRGEWTMNEGIYTQGAANLTDYILNTDIYAVTYTAEVEITLPLSPEVSGGLVIHMPQPERKSGAFLVRLIRGGEAIFWGAYDEAGVFQGRASAELTAPAATEGVYQLKLVVRGNRLDILVDGAPIANDVLMPRGEGWIGLLAHSGPISFRNLHINIGLAP